MSNILKFSFLSIAILAVTNLPLHADESKEVDTVKKLEQIATRKVRGAVVSVGYQKISIETGREGGVSSEMMIPVSEKANFRGRKSLKDFQRGDTVDVTFEQTYTDEDNAEKNILKTSAVEILLIKNVESENLMASKEGGAKE